MPKIRLKSKHLKKQGGRKRIKRKKLWKL